MKKLFRTQLMIWVACGLIFTACQESEIINDPTGETSGKPVITIGNSSRIFITNNTTWTNNNIYLLDGEVIVRNATLTIQPGTVIMGKKALSHNENLNSSLIIDINAQLFAQGTPSSPVVFTSNQPVEERNPGDWGGVILLGSDIINANGAQLEGLVEPLSYGGSGDNRPQGSGILQYVRIEFGGNSLRNGGSSNGLTLAGVGSNTTIDHVQVSLCKEDAFEFFGGSVSARFLIAWKCRDDDFDTELGHTGTVQYAVSRRSSRGSGLGSNGIETENDGFGTNSTPETNTLFTNITFIGPGRLNGDGSEIPMDGIGGRFNAGFLVRRNSATSLLNSIITSWPTANNLRDTPTAQNYVTFNTLKLEGISVGLPAATGSLEIRTDNLSGGANTAVINRYSSANSANTVAQVVLGVTNPASIVGLNNAAFATGGAAGIGNPGGTPDFTLVSGSANLTNAVTLSAADLARGLEQTNYRGAFDTTTGSWDFNNGWLEFNPENAVYH